MQRETDRSWLWRGFPRQDFFFAGEGKKRIGEIRARGRFHPGENFPSLGKGRRESGEFRPGSALPREFA